MEIAVFQWSKSTMHETFWNAFLRAFHWLAMIYPKMFAISIAVAHMIFCHISPMLLHPALYLWRAAPGCPPCYPCALEYCQLRCQNLGTKSDFHGLPELPICFPWDSHPLRVPELLLSVEVTLDYWWKREFNMCKLNVFLQYANIHGQVYSWIYFYWLFLLRHKVHVRIAHFGLNQESTCKILWDNMQWNAATHALRN